MRDLNPELLLAREVCQPITPQTPLVQQTGLEPASSASQMQCPTNQATTIYCGEHCTRNKYLIRVLTIQQIGLSPCQFTLHTFLHPYVKEHLLLRRDEVPTPKHFTAPIVFKTSPSPTELSLHCLPTSVGQDFSRLKVDQQDVGELNSNLLMDSQAH